VLGAQTGGGGGGVLQRCQYLNYIESHGTVIHNDEFERKRSWPIRYAIPGCVCGGTEKK
jgi:hypothetical protein